VIPYVVLEKPLFQKGGIYMRYISKKTEELLITFAKALLIALPVELLKDFLLSILS
jgi:hypothetical protein